MANPNVRFDITANARTDMAFRKVRSQMQGMRRESRMMGSSTLRNRRIIQQAGMQMSDFAVQVGGGQSAILAFTQNVPQFVQGFGAIGGVLAAVITILGTLTLIAVRTGTSLNELTPLAGILRDEFEMLARVLDVVKETFIDFANILVNNLDRVAIYAATVAGIFAAKWVVGMVAAAGATGILSGALAFLRAAIIRTGFGALIIGAGELVYQFTRLVKGAGGFGEAIGILWTVAKDVFSRIADLPALIAQAVKVAAFKMHAIFAGKLFDMLMDFQAFVNKVIDGFNDAFNMDMSNVFIIGGVAQSVAEVALRARDADLAFRGMKESITAPIDGLEELRNAMRAADDEGSRIDVRDWFGGAADDEGGGGGGSGGGEKAVDGLSAAVKKAQENMQSLADTMKESFSSGIKAMVDGTKSFGDAIKDMAKSVIEKLFDILVVQQLVGSWDASTGTGSGFVGMVMSAIPSFSGGGYTGMGSRTGGIDGKGGFPAILHRNETVVDHTKGQGMGGSNITINMNVAANGDESVKRIMAQSAPMIAEAVESRIIDQRRRGGSQRATYG